ncbi:hypothetical protein Q427_26310 [Halomonas sp. BC04]|nr:hypothetical protein Q427_26310 [Halomonas sp. BC04]
MSLLQHAHGTRHANRKSACRGIHELERFAIPIEEQRFTGGPRRRFATIEGRDVAAVEVHQECTATDAAGLGLHQRQHHLHGNGGIHRRTAGPEYLVAGIGGERIRRCHREALGRPSQAFSL